VTNPEHAGRPRPATVQAPDDVLHLDVDVDSLYPMRAAVAAHASKLGLTEPKLANLLVVATELAANTIRHGGGNGTLRLWSDGDAIHCQVSDDGPGIIDPDIVGTKPVALNSDGGRGLWLSRQFTDGLAIENRDPGSTVTATMQL